MSRLICALLLGASTAWPIGVYAADDDKLRYDQVHLAASADTEVDTDVLVAVLFKEHQSAQQSEAANIVNQAITRAVTRTRSADLNAQTAAYRTHPVYRDRRIVGWRVHQSIRIESRDARKLAALLGDLQQDLSVQSLQNLLSPELRRKTEEGLIVEALEAFKARATLIAGTLSRTGYRIVSINVNTASAGRPPPIRTARTATLSSASVSAPTIEGGTQRVEVHINGSIELERR